MADTAILALISGLSGVGGAIVGAGASILADRRTELLELEFAGLLGHLGRSQRTITQRGVRLHQRYRFKAGFV